MAGIVLFLLVGISYLVWWAFRLQLLEVLRWIRVGELYLGTWIYGEGHMVAGQSLLSWREWLKTAPVTEITAEHVKVSTRVAVEPLRHLMVGLIVVMALLALFKAPGLAYRRRMNLEALMREQAKSFKTITPFLSFDPRLQPVRPPGAKVPAELPLFAEALSPEEWLAFHQVRYSGGQLDVSRAWQALSLQLGNRWQGPLKLPPHMQGLYAAFALKAVRRRRECEKLLSDMALSWSAEKGLRMSIWLRMRILRIIKNPKIGGALEPFASQHAYETTALLRCLQRARQEGGVLAPSEFVWLRGHDRALWYPLNNLGRKSYMAEAAGALVHFTGELIAGQKIPTPRFDEVIVGLQNYLKSGIGRDIPERDAEARHPQRVKQKRGKAKA